MDKTLAGLIGAAGLLATSAQAATPPPVTISDVMQVQSYADLLKPIPNATELLRASDAAQARIAESDAAGEAKITPVQWWWYDRRYRYHHHHHHRYWWYHHHHHHHHHHHYYHHHHHA
jgi:hypothetical protein